MAGVLVAPALYLVSPDVKKIACRMIKKEYHFLKFSPGTIDRYVNDYFNAIGNNMMVKAKWKIFQGIGFSWENSNQIRDLYKYFLLSTDFFIHKMDEDKVVNYIILYDPYKSPLSNPYSFVLYPPEKIGDV